MVKGGVRVVGWICVGGEECVGGVGVEGGGVLSTREGLRSNAKECLDPRCTDFELSFSYY